MATVFLDKPWECQKTQARRTHLLSIKCQKLQKLPASRLQNFHLYLFTKSLATAARRKKLGIRPIPSLRLKIFWSKLYQIRSIITGILPLQWWTHQYQNIFPPSYFQGLQMWPSAQQGLYHRKGIEYGFVDL